MSYRVLLTNKLRLASFGVAGTILASALLPSACAYAERTNGAPQLNASQSLAASKARAESDAEVIAGTTSRNLQQLISSSNASQSVSSPMPKPVKSLSVAAGGTISDSQAKSIAGDSLNVALNQSGQTTPKLEQTAQGFTAQDTNIVVPNRVSVAMATQDLSRQLTSQGYAKQQVNDAIAALTAINKTIAPQLDSNTLIIPTHAGDGVHLGAQVVLGLPSGSGSSNAQPLTQSAVVYGNTGKSTDTVVKAVDQQSLETYQIIRSKDAPEQYVYTLNNLPQGALLRQVNATTVQAYFPAQTFGQGAQAYSHPEAVLATISAPWARDANGIAVPISLSISTNNTVVMQVSHKNGNFLYPIVADPTARWGWWGFMWWGDNWTITHFSQIFVGIGIVASLASWGTAAAVAGTISLVATWCQGRNGATFYFDWAGDFYYCHGW